MSREREDRIDAAIDDAARRMTEGAPGADFKARVLERIDDSTASHGRWRRAWLLSPLAVAALVVIAVLLWRGSAVQQNVMRSVPTEPGTPIISAEAVPVGKPDVTGDSDQVRLKPDATGKVDAARLNRIASRRLLSPSDLDALAPPPLQVDSIALGEIAPVNSIEIPRPQAIAPIALAPLDEGDRP